ncbi:MAG: pyridoxamine 5'-phosphate oxidase [Rhodobacteraceae bacterium CG17_big_fil_post_rev_8_21_14_2_50_63_15]|nr:pyridoxamine 5'-phosphate oxidase family protein [Roseovarius sp.]PIV79684.1 MAG: pyridoxamine 5'-phosphate oxidase [Rhodobacteraceae bacterium CG17_big_fil_post_rev_8_21_14_2_50_63_15]
MALAFAEIAFTPAVRAQQERGGAGQYARFLSVERTGGDLLGEEERTFVEARDGFYQATVSETGWPYVQFRGGPRGFLRVLDPQTIAYADLRGNRQYISMGNLTVNDRISLILMDYAAARRLKIWGRVRIDGPEAAKAAGLVTTGGARVERMVRIHVAAFDWNCPSHIPRRLTVEEASGAWQALKRENAALLAEVRALREALAATGRG